MSTVRSACLSSTAPRFLTSPRTGSGLATWSFFSAAKSSTKE